MSRGTFGKTAWQPHRKTGLRFPMAIIFTLGMFGAVLLTASPADAAPTTWSVATTPN
jgi:hypothetical protein